MTTDPTLLALAAARFDLAPDRLHELHGGDVSAVYSFARDGAGYVLRITPPNADIDAAAMRAILAWVHTLDTHGASVAGPIRSAADHLVETIGYEGDRYLVTAVKQAPGVLAETLPYARWSNALIRAWGRTAGKMHAIAQACRGTDAARRLPDWDTTGNCFNESLPEELADSAVAQRLAEVRAAVRALPKAPSRYGVIHTDFHAANFYVDPATATITVFDFDDCSRGWYMMDIAMALFDVLVVHSPEDRMAFAAHFLHQYLAGYRQEKPLDPGSIAQLPNLLKLLEISIYTQVYADHDPADTTSWVGKFMAEDRQGRIESGVPYVALDLGRVLAGLQQ